MELLHLEILKNNFICRISHGDLSDYTCVARNGEGRIHHTVRVVIAGQKHKIFSLSLSKIFSITNRKCFTTFKLFAEILVATASFTRICFENLGIFPKKTFKDIIQYSTVNMFNTFISKFLKSFYLEKLNLLLNDKIDTKQFSSLPRSPALSSEAPKLDPNSILPEMKIIYIQY